jgi:prolyl oligopeptidase
MTGGPAQPTRRDETVVDEIAGHAVRDPYRWLEIEDDAAVVAWLAAQDDACRRGLAGIPERDAIAARIRELFYFGAVSAPLRYGRRCFYTRKLADREKSIVCFCDDDTAAEVVLFDPEAWSADGSVGLGGYWPSHDGALVAYSIKQHNSDETITRVRDVVRGDDLTDVVTGTKYSGASWTPDGSGFYYTYVPPVSEVVTVAERPGRAELRFHRLGTDPATDAIVRGATGDPRTFLSGGVSRDGHWLVASVQHGWNATDVYLRDARDPDAPWVPLVEGVAANFGVQVWRGIFYVHTDEGAPRYRVLTVDAGSMARAHWRELVAESDATLQNAQVVGERLVLTYLRDAASELEIRTLDGALVRRVALPPLGTAAGMAGNEDEDDGYVAYTSFTEPGIIYRTSVSRGGLDEWSRVTLPFDPAVISVDQVRCTSRDGTQIPMFILRRSDVRQDGTAPTVLYGYGGFNVSLTPAFAGSRLAWLERGGVYAIANLRGGGEFGEAWHRAGMLAAKQNVFDDFIAAAEYLIRERWTASRHLAISGGSNGGLLVGAVMTQRPELCRAAICAVPLLDMLRYHRFGSGATWIPEYGSVDDADQAAYLWAYSPYRAAVDAGPRAYPAVLFDSADHDDRVDPMHARKLTAVLQHAQTQDLPVWLRVERNAGHGGADLVRQQVDRVADQLAFLFHYLR